jgi:hypothetical protein
MKHRFLQHGVVLVFHVSGQRHQLFGQTQGVDKRLINNGTFTHAPSV